MHKIRTVLSLGFVKEALGSVIPTSLGYYGLEKQVGWQNAVIIAICFAILMFVIMIYAKLEEYTKSISRILAIGYYTNFVERLIYVLQSTHQPEIVFHIGEKAFSIKKSIIEVKFLKANSHNELNQIRSFITKETANAYIDMGAANRPFFVDAKYDKAVNTFTIYECPRTLLSLSKYVKLNDASEEKLNQETKTYYKYFNIEFEEWWCRTDKVGVNVSWR